MNYTFCNSKLNYNYSYIIITYIIFMSQSFSLNLFKEFIQFIRIIKRIKFVIWNHLDDSIINFSNRTSLHKLSIDGRSNFSLFLIF